MHHTAKNLETTDYKRGSVRKGNFPANTNRETNKFSCAKHGVSKTSSGSNPDVRSSKPRNKPSRVATADATQEPSLINDAIVIGENHEDLSGLMDKKFTFMTGDLYDQGDRRNTQAGGWKKNEFTWGEFLTAEWSPLTTHPEGKSKQGSSIVLGETIDGNRNAESVKTMEAIVIDIDSGPTVDSVIAKLEELGIFGIVYTSFNHNKTRVELKHDDVVRKLKLDDTPNRMQVLEYLKEHHKDRYDDDFMQGIQITEARHHGPKGLQTILETPPLHKFRVVLPLWETVELASLGTTASKWKEKWADIVTGFCVNVLGVSFDSTSCDVNRLFYAARHPKDGDWISTVVLGRPVRAAEIEPHSKNAYIKNREPLNPFSMAGGGADDDRPPQCLAPSGMVLNAWHTKAKERFLITDLLMAEAGDKVRREASDGKLEIECPFEHGHSTEGGTGTLAMSPHVNEHGVWSVSCPHDACQGRHKLEYLEEMLKAGWFSEDCLTDDEYLIPGDDEQKTVSATEVKKALTELNEDSGDTDIKCVIRKFTKIAADETTFARLKSEIVEKTPLTKTQAEKMIKNVRAEYSQEAKEDGEDDKFFVMDGFFYHAGSAEKGMIRLCQTFDVVGRSSGQSGEDGAGVIITFVNQFGRTIEKTLDNAVLFRGTGGDIIPILADAGLVLAPMVEQDTRHAFIELLQSLKSDVHIPTAPVPGWQRDRAGDITGYLLNNGKMIPVNDKSPVIRLHSTALVKDRETMGTLEGWQIAADAALSNPANFYWTLCLAAGFVGPVMGLTGSSNCGFNLSGDSSKGKTMAGRLAASIWASPLEGNGVLHGMNCTPNAFEDLAVKSSGSILVMDEIGAMQNLKGLSTSLFGLASGVGKNRKVGAGMGLADTAEFQTFTIITNEHGLKTTITNAGGIYKTGLSARFPDIDVSMGVRVDDKMLAKLEKVKTDFGHAGPLFVQHLIYANWITRIDEMKKLVSAAVDEIAGKEAAQATKRAAGIFALIQVSGELAVEAGLLSEKAAVKKAVKAAYASFMNSDEGMATEGESSMLAALRSYLNREQGKSIIPGDEAGLTHYGNVIGWYDDDWYVLDWTLINDLSKLGINGKRTALMKALDEIGALEKSGSNNYHNALPRLVKSDGTSLERKVSNIRIKRAVLEV